jgi:hypothetical protein
LLFSLLSRLDAIQQRGVEERLWGVAGVKDRDCFHVSAWWKSRRSTSVTSRGFVIKGCYGKKLLLLNLALTSSAGWLEMTLGKLSWFSIGHFFLIQLQLRKLGGLNSLILLLQRSHNTGREDQDFL